MNYDHLLDLHNRLRALRKSSPLDDTLSEIDCPNLQKTRYSL